LIEWLLQCSRNAPKQLRRALLDLFTGQLNLTPDVRYTLARVLHSEAVQKTFDLIVIDCSPRLTTSKIQAFCASSHLLVPTIFDRASGEAVASLRDQVEMLRCGQICPYLKYIGVVGIMWKRGRIAQKEAETFIKDALGKDSIGIFPELTFIPHATALVNNASEGIAYRSMPNGDGCQEIRGAIGQLSKHIAEKMGISRYNYFREPAE
jgi:chromosome partitioning protein